MIAQLLRLPSRFVDPPNLSELFPKFAIPLILITPWFLLTNPLKFPVSLLNIIITPMC